MSVELAGDMRNVVAGFLENDRVEAAADCSEDLCGSPACWAWVPLEHLVVHEVTDRVGEGSVKGMTWEAQRAPACAQKQTQTHQKKTPQESSHDTKPRNGQSRK